MQVLLITLAAVGGPAIIFAFIALSLAKDPKRIERDIRRHGGQVVSIEQTPLGKGTLSTPGGSMQYHVVYRDDRGRLHEAECRTDWVRGNRWTDIRRVDEGGDNPDPNERGA